MSTVKLGKMIDCELDEKEEKQKKKKSKKEEAAAAEEPEPSEPSDEVTSHHPVLLMTILTHHITPIFTATQLTWLIFKTFQGKKVKKSVSFKLEPEIETYDSNHTKKVIRKVKRVVQVKRVRQLPTLNSVFNLRFMI